MSGKRGRKRFLQWAATSAAALIMMLMVAVMIVVHTSGFRHFALERIEQAVQTRLGARLDIQQMSIHLRLLVLDFYGITLHGRERGSQAPLFTANHVRVGLKIVSILRREIDLDEVVLDQPAAHLDVDRDGHSNLPRSPLPRKESTVDTLFDLAVRHLEVNSGQIYYNDRESPVTAELHDFRAQIHFLPVESEYRGTLGYDEGVVTSESFRPIPHRLTLSFAAGRTGIRIDSATLATQNSTLTAYGQLKDYERPRIEGACEAQLSTTELARFTDNTSIPVGKITLSGSLRYNDEPDKTAVDSIYLDGRMTSPQLAARAGKLEITAKTIRADYRLQNGNLSVRNAEADMLGGHISANYELSRVSGNGISRLNASIHDISLAAVDQKVGPQNRGAPRISGRIDGTAEATWPANIRDGIVRAHLAIQDADHVAVSASTIPLNGLIEVKYDGAHKIAQFGQSYVRTGNTTVSITGVLSDRSQLDVQANTSDLKEVAALASMFEGGSPSAIQTRSPLPTDLQGSARFTGQVLGSVKQPRIKGELFANDLEVQTSRWRSLRLNVDVASSDITVQNGYLEGTQEGQISFNGHAALAAWSLPATSPISLQLTAKQISIADLQKITQSKYPVSGELAANLVIRGTEKNPQGQGSIQLTRASAWHQPVTSLTADFRGDGDSIHSNVQLAIPAGNLTAQLTYQPNSQSYDVNLHTAGIKLDQLEAVQHGNLGVAGTLMLSADGHGSIQKPQIAVTLQVAKLKVWDQTITDLQAQANLADQRADFTLSSKAQQGSIEAKGSVGLNGEYPATMSLDVRAIPVAAVLAEYLPKSQEIHGQTELHANLTGPLKNPYAIVAQMEVPVLDVDYQAVQLGLARPLRMSYRNGVAYLDEVELKGTGTHLSLKGTVPVTGAARPLNVSANGTIDLSLLQAFASGVQSSGRIEIDISARGDLSHPAMQGKIDIANASVSSESIPVGIESLNGRIQVSGNRLDIAQLSGVAGGGTVAAHGFLTYGGQSTFNLGVDAQSVRIRYPEGIRSVLTGNLTLTGNPGQSQLTGRVLIDGLSLTQQFDLATLLGQLSAETPTAVSSSLEQHMKLNVAVATATGINLASSKLSLEGAANLNLTGTMAFPVLLGRATLTGGEVFFMGKRYEIQSGTVEFANPTRTAPVVNLYAKTTVQQYNLTLNFVGPINRLRTNYTSDPPLPPADIINLVAFGKTAEQAATSPSTPATLGAESVLAQGAASQLSGKLERLTGISQLTINPLADNSQTNPGTQVAIQQRVTGNILLTFSTDVTSTQNQAIQVQYQVKKNLSVSALRDQYGAYAADVRIHKTF